MTTYLHIGYPKTATKFLQFNIFPKLDVEFFFLGGIPKGKYKRLRKMLDYTRDPNNKVPYRYFGSELKYILSDKKDNLISFESLIGEIYNPNTKDMKIIPVRLYHLFPNSKIIICIREKESILKSLYSQYIKEGGILIEEDFRTKFFNHQRLNYEHIINIFIEMFGEENVLVVQFETLKENPKKFVKQICDFMGQDVPQFTNERLNPSYSKKQMELQRFLNHAFKTKLNPHGLPPQRLWELLNPAKKIALSKISRRIMND